MLSRKAPVWLVLFAVALCWVPSPLPVEGQATSYMTNNTNPCVAGTYKYAAPNFTSPVTVFINKFLTTPRACATTLPGGGMNNASCNPGVLAATASLAAFWNTGFGINPFCQWYCLGCTMPTITTDAANDGLPVELMDFAVED